jgi:GDP-4-dehydro-6-deoxy-D-mannose reductase
MSRVTLITGAAGFAGSHLLDLLGTGSIAHPWGPPSGGPIRLSASARIARYGETSPKPGEGAKPDLTGHETIVGWFRPGGTAPAPVDLSAAGALETPRGSAVTWEAIDILDRSSVVDAIARLRPAVVYHCAGAAHVGQAWEHTEATLALNVRGTHHLLDALCRAGGATRVLIPGSALVYRPASEALTEEHPLIPASPYGVSKLAQELLAGRTAAPGVAITIARAFNHFGPRQDPAFSTSGFARQIASIEAGLQPPEISVGNLDARRDLTDVRDTVRAYRAIAERGQPGRAYNVCSGHAVAIRAVLDLLVERARVPIRVRVDPARFRPNDVPLLLGDSSRLRDELGWIPEIQLTQTLDDILLYWRREVSKAMM